MTTSAYRLLDPLSPYRALARHYTLIVQMAKRDIASRYRGSFMGLFWSFFNPLLMLAIYTFVFGVVFKARWNEHVTGHVAFAVILFAGLNISTMFSECAGKAATVIVDNVNFVKKVIFPLESLSWSVLGAALFHLMISTIALLVIELVAVHRIPWTVVLFPVVVAVFLPFVAGTVWLLASLGVFLRDIKQAIAIVTTALMFLAPIMYPMSMIPGQYRIFLYLNPLTVIAMASQKVLFLGEMPRWDHLGLYLVASVLFAWAAFAWFERTRKGFADVV
ncbi:MAG TPA: ABC transporter permease [Rhodanobacteraceae bacterium]|nr:ABC transporter permease [Rhodanobacteraceae bacterium]